MSFPSVSVVMSTYNGEKTIVRQLDSILTQKNVSVTVVVRDDGSKDNTLMVLNEYRARHPEVVVIQGENIGWERSFMKALQQSPKSDYYAFSDQDDIWFEDKLCAGINQIANVNSISPVLYHCNKLSVRENLTPLRKQIVRTPRPLNHQNALVQEYAQGCAIIMNFAAKELVCRHTPRQRIAHDFWCGLICYLFGTVIYDEKKYFYHINYGSNASGEGHKWKSRLKRLGKYCNSSCLYYNPSQDLLEGYSDMLSLEDKLFAKKIQCYKSSLKYKLSLLLSKKFIRASIVGTLSLKAAILINKL